MSGRPTPPKIAVRNAQRKIRVQRTDLQKFAERSLYEAMQLRQPAGSLLPELEEINLVIVSDARMAAVHKTFLDIAGPTDVITFQHGEIVISAETAQRNAAEYQTSAEDEIRLYIVHGILHLMGFDDTTDVAARSMDRMQKRIFAAALRPRAEASHRGAAV